MEPWHDRIKRLRKAAGLTQRQIAYAFEIAPSSVAQWESGRSRPDVDKLPMLAKLLHTDLETLAGSDFPAVGQGDRLSLLRIYDELDDDAKQIILRMAIQLARKTKDDL